MWVKAYVFASFLTFVLSEYLSEDERNLSMDVAIRLQVSHMILLGPDITMMRYLSRFRRFGAYMSLKMILDSIHSLSQERSLVVWKMNKTEMVQLEALMIQRHRGICKPQWLLIQTEDFDMTSTYDCEVILVDSMNNKSRFRLTEVYSIAGRRFEIEFGFWSSKAGLTSSSLAFYDRRKNMEGVPFMVNKMALPPEFIQVFGKAFVPQQEAFYGLSKTHNFTLVAAKHDFVLDETPKPLFGSQSYNMLLTGVVGVFMYIKEPGYMRDSGHFLHPFASEVWISICAIVVLGTVVLFVSHYVEGQSRSSDSKKQIVKAFFTVFSLFCNQDGDEASEKNSIRFLHFVIRITALVVVPAYCAVTTSFLTYQIIKTPFQDFEGLLEDGSYHIGAHEKTFTLAYFNMSNDKTVRRVGKTLLLPPLISIPDGIKKMCDDKKFVYLDYNSWVEGEPKPCALMKLPRAVIKLFVGVIFPDDFPFADAFRSRHVVFFTSGLYNRFNKLSLESPVKNNEKDAYVPVDFELIQMAVLLMSFGVLLSVIIFHIEIIISRYRQDTQEYATTLRKLDKLNLFNV